ncbi:Uu.00g013030.m01.CDS01 [Anthostomella pinea]|uniref:Uu.00g013030.m01.CDS01 n=1 Tax=Anthostomella pinea TaxID=933095 RepID=A0AAI8VYR0_9PEZI|nr:Uu.00g013030.m01.CDS01 [Anthostomella pinea]
MKLQSFLAAAALLAPFALAAPQPATGDGLQDRSFFHHSDDEVNGKSLDECLVICGGNSRCLQDCQDDSMFKDP